MKRRLMGELTKVAQKTVCIRLDHHHPQQDSRLHQPNHPTEGSQVDAQINDLQVKFDEMINVVNCKHSSIVKNIL
jgi:hypothetical protein